MVFKSCRLFVLLAAMISLSACLSGPPPKLYLLEAPKVQETDTAVQVADIQALGISQVVVPGYATDERIASLSDNGVVSLLDGERWAESPEDAITRLLGQQLRLRGAQRVLQEPWPRDFKPDARVELIFETLIRRSHGGASLAGQIHLISSNGRALLQMIPFDFVVRGESRGSLEFFRAVATGIDEIARIAIEALSEELPS